VECRVPLHNENESFCDALCASAWRQEHRPARAHGAPGMTAELRTTFHRLLRDEPVARAAAAHFYAWLRGGPDEPPDPGCGR